MSRNCPKNPKNNQQGHDEPKKTYIPCTNARITEIVDDRDDASKAGSNTTIVSQKPIRVNATKLKPLPDEVIKAIIEMTKEQ
jgi:hypothetical protein